MLEAKQKETSDIDFAVDITGEADEEEAYWNLYGDFLKS